MYICSRLIANQVFEVFSNFLVEFPGIFKTFVATGGSSTTKNKSAQCRAFLHSNSGHVILIATPGCMLEFITVWDFLVFL